MAPFETPLEERLVKAMYKRARAERISQADLAEAADVSREAMSSYINGHRPIPLRVLIAALDRVGLDFQRLLSEM